MRRSRRRDDDQLFSYTCRTFTSAVVMLVALLSTGASLNSYWWQSGSQAASLWKYRVTMLGVFTQDFAWTQVCGSSVIANIGNVRSVCGTIKWTQAAVFMALCTSLAASVTTVSVACWKIDRESLYYLTIQGVLDFLAMLFNLISIFGAVTIQGELPGVWTYNAGMFMACFATMLTCIVFSIVITSICMRVEEEEAVGEQDSDERARKDPVPRFGEERQGQPTSPMQSPHQDAGMPQTSPMSSPRGLQAGWQQQQQQQQQMSPRGLHAGQVDLGFAPGQGQAAMQPHGMAPAWGPGSPRGGAGAIGAQWQTHVQMSQAHGPGPHVQVMYQQQQGGMGSPRGFAQSPAQSPRGPSGQLRETRMGAGGAYQNRVGSAPPSQYGRRNIASE